MEAQDQYQVFFCFFSFRYKLSINQSINQFEQIFELGLIKERKQFLKKNIIRDQIFTFDFLAEVGRHTGIRAKFYKVDESCRGFNSACVSNGYLYRA